MRDENLESVLHGECANCGKRGTPQEIKLMSIKYVIMNCDSCNYESIHETRLW